MSEEQPPPDVYALLRQWDEENAQPNYDPIPLLNSLAEIIESEAEAFMKMNPDPFDERHPSRAYPSSQLGHTLKVLFRKEQFMTKLVNDYLRDNYYSRQAIQRDVRKLNIAACRLMLDITPGLETSAVFEIPTNDGLVRRLFSWVENSVEPLQTYATGLLAAATDVQEIAVVYREQNLKLVPLMLERLHKLQEEALEEQKESLPTNCRPFAHLGSCDSVETPNGRLKKKRKLDGKSPRKIEDGDMKKIRLNGSFKKEMDGDSNLETPRRQSTDGMMSPPQTKPSPYNASDCSNSSWAEMETYVIGFVQMYPLTLATKQLFILKYLTPLGEYQEFLSHVFEKNALDLILQLVNLRETKHARLSFEALKYLASLLCHKKFSIEFINVQGLQRLLEIPRPSIAATGVSICLYYLAYCEDAMERVCLLPQHVLSDLVRYALWLLECSHDSGRCHATMFFGLSFQFRVILEEFDAQDGLRKLYNVISTLPILAYDSAPMNEDEECSARQIVRQVCVALKRYFEAHLYIRSEPVRRAHLRDISSDRMYSPAFPSYKACKSSPEQIREQINTLLELMSFRSTWAPVDQFLRLGGISLLLQVIAFAYDWNYSGRGETVRSALDVLGICAVMPRVLLQLCEKVDLPDDVSAMGINVILGAAEGEIVTDPEVQRAALQVLITCVCAPISRVEGVLPRYSSGMHHCKKKTRSSEEVIEKLWDCVRISNGVMVLLSLIQLKVPITDADSIRGLACQALAGLARSETVRQIIGKLPLFTTGHLQNLMKDPVLPDRRQEHAHFQKYAMELLERVSGKPKPRNELEPTFTNIHRASVLAQTRIQFNDRDLLQLIQQHLVSHGMPEAADVLSREAGLPPIRAIPPPPSTFLSPFTYQRSTSTPPRSRSMSLKGSPMPLTPGCHKTPTSSTNQSPIRLNISSKKSLDRSLDRSVGEMKPPEIPPLRSLEKRTPHERIPNLSHPQSVSLDSIVTEYLMSQHSLCKNPMATCPQFNLFELHKCPEPKVKNLLPNNFTLRHSRGLHSRRLDNRLIHSRFCAAHVFRFSGENAFFTSCDFFGDDKYIVIGSHQGEVKLFNLCSGAEVSSYHCHESYISHLMCARKAPLFITSSTWRQPLSSCWSIKDHVFNLVLPMDDEDYVEFNKITEDKIIGTRNETATIYDIETKKLLQTLKPSLSNQYNKNRATFSPDNELVLSDGVLWDVNSGKEIRKLDKLNQSLSGVFHPNGVEIVSNTEVWDLRTFHLLRTVPALDQCDILFSPTGYTIYAVTAEKETEEDSSYENSFKTLDAYDYTSIATIDVKKSIHDLACNLRDTQIAVVENQGLFDSVQESIVKLYDIGRLRTTDDEVEEEDEEEDMDGGDGSNGDDDHQNDTLPLEIFNDFDGDFAGSDDRSDSSSSTTIGGDDGDDAESLESVALSGPSDDDDDDDDDDDLDFF